MLTHKDNQTQAAGFEAEFSGYSYISLTVLMRIKFKMSFNFLWPDATFQNGAVF